MVKSKSALIKWTFSSIQEAINEAENGSIIHVPADVYFERIVVNKTVSLVGEDASATIIDGSNSGTVVEITADNVTLANFTIRNSGWGWTRNGVYVYKADNCTIQNNILINNCHNIRLNCSRNSHVLKNTINGDGYGIRLINSFNCTAIANNVSNCIGGVHLENATNCIVKKNFFTQNSQGIRMYSPCTYNIITENTVYCNTYDGMIEAMPGNTTFYYNFIFHNSFINNANPFLCKGFGNIWDKGYPTGGNYWSRYNGTDSYKGPYQNETGSDGIGDTPYVIATNNIDRYPLFIPVHNINTGIGYDSIQSAIDAPETLNRHTLWIDSGVYHENVNVNKSLTLIGENPLTTIIDGNNVGTILAINADNVTVAGFTIRNSGSNLPPYGTMDCGILLNHVSGCNISHNVITSNNIGLYLSYSQNNFIEHNTVSFNGYEGLWLWYSGNNVLTRNELFNNSCNFGVFGGNFTDFNNTVDTSNTVNGKLIQYDIGVENEVYDQTDTGVLYLINCNNITVQSLSLTKNGHGIFFYNVTNSKIENVTTLENNYGICLQDSANNTVTKNNCSANWVGILLQDSTHNTVKGNTASKNEKGISLYTADNNIIAGNTVFSNDKYGIRFFSSSFNQIFHNNLIENKDQIDLVNSYQNVWDNGFEGNYWSDYIGVDADRDGLGDTSYTIDYSNSDSHPLFGAFHNFTVSYQNNIYEVTVISNSTIISCNFHSENNTIKLVVNGGNETHGFCRVSIPYALMDPNGISVIIDNGQTIPLYVNYTLRDNGVYRWIYFAYPHSVHEITIIPELWHVLFLSTFVIATLLIITMRATSNPSRENRKYVG